MEAVYHKLLEVRIWHDYYLPADQSLLPRESFPVNYNILDFLDVVPTEECEALMNQHRLLFRRTKIGFQLIAEVFESLIDGIEESQTVIPLRGNLKFSFILSLRDPYFLNYTSLPIERSLPEIYYTSNLVENSLDLVYEENEEPERTRFLTHPLSTYTGNEDLDYRIGDLVRENTDLEDDNSGAVFELIHLPIEIVPSPEEEEEDSWLTGKNSQYLNKQDAVPLVGNTLIYEQANSAELAGTAFQFQVTNQIGEVQKLGNQNIPDTEIPIEAGAFPVEENEPLRQRLDLLNLPTGRYHLDWDVELPLEDPQLPFDFFRIDPKKYRNPFAVVELFSIEQDLGPGLGVPVANRFIENIDNPEAGVLPDKISIISEKIFNIHIKNRPTHWRYFSRLDRTELIHESEGPIPMTRAYKGFFVESETDMSKIYLPNPSIRSVKEEKVIDELNEIEFVRYVSKIYL